jgi:hypothetical protein
VRDGQYALFHLVKDVTVAPKRGVPVSIPIKETFVLPAGQAYYEFPLLQGAEGNELRCQAYLKSPAFPLNADVPCRLVMTFTFGEDEPYQLVFIPLDPRTAGFASVPARWQRRSTVAPTEVAFPRFPNPAAWEELQHWPKPGSDETSDLLEWISEGLEKLAKQVDSLTQDRHLGTITSAWRTDRKGQLYTFAECDVGFVFCHFSAFLEEPDTEAVGIDDTVSFDLSESESGLRGQWITLGDDTPPAATNEILSRKIDELTRSMRKGLRFPFLTVWSGGRSLHDTTVPNWFHEVISHGNDALVRLLTMPITESASARCQDKMGAMKDDAMFLLCCLHQDAPVAVAEKLLEVCEDMPRSFWLFSRLYRHIGLAVGDATLPWQKAMFQKILSISADFEPKHSSVCLRALAVGLWRHPRLLDQFSADDLGTTLQRLADALEFDATWVSEEHDYYQEEVVKDHLEILLGLLSTRGSMDSGIRSFLAPGQPLTERVAQVVERIADKLCQHNVPLRSRVRLSVAKPPALYNTPDLLYALRLYLTGDSAARVIKVTGVSDEITGVSDDE